ncbi:hypothetical protein [Nocardia arthritidis]|uniref:hypothetical protein n=1 Tax=Nocardia arthritidis TaxID=228602 RepID=UPI000A7FE90F|nr:hypothetical protein [Nocardia arthritidis]
MQGEDGVQPVGGGAQVIELVGTQALRRVVEVAAHSADVAFDFGVFATLVTMASGSRK